MVTSDVSCGLVRRETGHILTLKTAIQAPAHAPALHPHDRPLLRPIAALGKPKVAEANVSFLRRTEYISSSVTKRHEMPRALLARHKKRHIIEPAADSPHAIKRKIDKSFELAEQDLKDPKRIKHPSKRHLKLVDAAPLIPDLDAFPDSGAYVTIKFLTNPVTSSNVYDSRLSCSLFKPIDRTQAEEEAYDAACEAYAQDPDNVPRPQNLMNYDFYLAQSSGAADRFRRKFDVENPDHDDEDLYTHQGDNGGCFQFNRVRAYETAQETEYDHSAKYDGEIIIAYNDDTFYPNQKAAYYYPVMQKSTIRPQRTKNIARTIGIADEEEQIVDRLDVTVEEPQEGPKEAMRKYKEHPLGIEDEDDEQQDQDAEGDEAEHRRSSSPAPLRARSPSEDLDAEGEED